MSGRIDYSPCCSSGPTQTNDKVGVAVPLDAVGLQPEGQRCSQAMTLIIEWDFTYASTLVVLEVRGRAVVVLHVVATSALAYFECLVICDGCSDGRRGE